MLKGLIEKFSGQVHLEIDLDPETFECTTKTYVGHEVVSEVVIDANPFYEAFKNRLHAEWYPDENK